jgi:hypothetical protein
MDVDPRIVDLGRIFGAAASCHHWQKKQHARDKSASATGKPRTQKSDDRQA